MGELDCPREERAAAGLAARRVDDPAAEGAVAAAAHHAVHGDVPAAHGGVGGVEGVEPCRVDRIVHHLELHASRVVDDLLGVPERQDAGRVQRPEVCALRELHVNLLDDAGARVVEVDVRVGAGLRQACRRHGAADAVARISRVAADGVHEDGLRRAAAGLGERGHLGPRARRGGEGGRGREGAQHRDLRL